MAQQQLFQAPKGTRDFYPAEMARRRYIERAWREVSIRHGFEEIDGPTFEHRELYEAKSGEGILGEMFGVFSGKDPEQVAAAGQGRAEFGLRPEFTPTLARMYAAKASSLPKPTKWFWQQNCFRAERPQRGRLREFLQWNVDLIGDGSAAADAEVIACCVGLLESLGLRPGDVRVRYSHREVLGSMLASMGLEGDEAAAAFVLLDRRDKLADDELEAMAFEFGLSERAEFLQFLKRPRGRSDFDSLVAYLPDDAQASGAALAEPLRAFENELEAAGVAEWCDLDLNIARGLAYYTGMVFEVYEASGAERAIAGGGRYDKLIETFGGPPTPAVGFGMGDVVLSLVLQDRGLMPDDKTLLERVGARPEVFVIPGEGDEAVEAEKALRPLVAKLRRAGLHVRHSYKATRKTGKLLKEAASQHAKLAVILESGTHAQVKDLDEGKPLGEAIPFEKLEDVVRAALGGRAGR